MSAYAGNGGTEAMQPATYIMASSRNGTLYVGVTSDLIARVWQHREGFVPGFTKLYDVHDLVYFEMHDEMLSAIAREKQIKRWKRKWKLNLIESNNPNWEDLFPALVGKRTTTSSSLRRQGSRK